MFPDQLADVEEFILPVQRLDLFVLSVYFKTWEKHSKGDRNGKCKKEHKKVKIHVATMVYNK